MLKILEYTLFWIWIRLFFRHRVGLGVCARTCRWCCCIFANASIRRLCHVNTVYNLNIYIILAAERPEWTTTQRANKFIHSNTFWSSLKRKREGVQNLDDVRTLFGSVVISINFHVVIYLFCFCRQRKDQKTNKTNSRFVFPVQHPQ